MTTQTIERTDEAVSQTAEPAKKVWHIPATEADYVSRNEGGPWTTLCGIVKPTCRRLAWGFELSDIEKCVVCRETARL